jgi:hypothetical protein
MQCEFVLLLVPSYDCMVHKLETRVNKVLMRENGTSDESIYFPKFFHDLLESLICEPCNHNSEPEEVQIHIA